MPPVPPEIGRLFRSLPYDDPVRFLRSKLPAPPDIALVLGSGLGDYAEVLPHRLIFPSGAIPSYPRSTVPGHKGQIVYAELAGRRLIAIQGRVHLYECNDIAMVLLPVAVAAALGAGTLIVTNAAGGINRELIPGDLMLITDQLDLTFHAAGIPGERGSRAELFDPALVEHASRHASRRGLPLRRGVYAAVKGPSYETAAEVDMIRRLGGDAVGMSTVKEVALASALGMRVMGISCITNRATGTGGSKLNHEEVTDVARRVKTNFANLVTDCISDLDV
ncbi:MAG TPA: purine-nucleoside phosphorylase [Bacteroidota bacterium]|nr:purine-nucleoside phosphorylase [Bacteroidota bacterium]